MGATAARKLPDDEPDSNDEYTPQALRERHLYAVPDEFVAGTAATFRADQNSVLVALSLMAIAMGQARSDELADPADGTSSDLGAWLQAAGDPSAVDYDEVLRVSDGLASTFRTVSENLRAEQGNTIASSEVRQNWAGVLGRVRDDGALLYITHQGERAAALVPPYVADFYRDAEDKIDAEAIDQARADREGGEEPVALDDLLGELGL